MNKILKTILKVLIFGILTITTQIGGVAYLISVYLNRKWKTKLRLKPIITFLVVYLIFTIMITPLLAPLFGREKVKNTDIIKPTNYMTVLLNRNYVKPNLNKLLENAEKELKNSGIKIHYLDANFPFINKFPLLPHLSHNDGKKIDISLIYEEISTGKISPRKKSLSGYGVFESPKPNEYNQVEKCLNNGYFQYDYPKYLTFGEINADLTFSEKGTKKVISSFLKSKSLGKLFFGRQLKHWENFFSLTS